MKETEVQGLKKIRTEMENAFMENRQGKFDLKDVIELSNALGKINNSYKTQVEYSHKRAVTPNMPQIDGLEG